MKRFIRNMISAMWYPCKVFLHAVSHSDQGVLDMTATENTIRFSVHTLDKATKAKVTLENYYSNLIAQHVERKQSEARRVPER
ncbi:unnamed protein product [Callosobruchus maculatus]|uniref:Uncharacterized protein n=1 Tax=Callosobruchus maculatus TaxID=64391 RepID=A0A653C5N3_CALMS|nr:unnamed protein product [Callosobruchus maculatus]